MALLNEHFYPPHDVIVRRIDGTLSSMRKASYESAAALYDVCVIDGERWYARNGEPVTPTAIHRAIEARYPNLAHVNRGK